MPVEKMNDDDDIKEYINKDISKNVSDRRVTSKTGIVTRMKKAIKNWFID